MNFREHAADEVFVTGTFDDWQKTVKLEKVHSVFRKTVELPKTHTQYKVRLSATT
jgi:SpoVK/Ycf46/Vps4 family AAA+-type ATPase